jgi:DNA polymerase elongation subunit (family B)
LVNRIQKVLGDEVAKRLSPVDVIYSRNIVSKFGKYNTRWHLKGVSCVDYLDVYKKFSQGLRESYKLNDVGEHELGEKKVDFGDMNLATLADTDWKTFVDYNIQDVNLLVKMEEKLQYLELLRMLAYVGLTPFENAMGTLNVITGAAVVEGRKNELIVPTFVTDKETSRYEGAYVGEPERGFKEYIVSFDLNSLYPNIMISLNLSPETKMGKFHINKDNVTVHKLKGDPSDVPKNVFAKTLKDLNLSISKANIIFSQKKKGIFPTIVDNFYNERVKIRRRMNKCKRQLADLPENDPSAPELKDKINKLHIKQFTIKIFINTVYGYFGNKHAPMGDPDISRSITLTGQAVLKQSNKILTEYFKDKCQLTDEQVANDPIVVYNDTDSVYITIKHIINKLDIPFTTRTGKITKQAHSVVNDIEKHLNEKIVKWGQSVLNSSDCRFKFKRESICDAGIFLQKKRYILHVLDDEGISVSKFKYTGVEVVRTTMPKAIKPYVKNIIETMIITKDFTKTNAVLNEAYDIFKSLPLEDIAFVMGISRYSTESRDDYGNIKDKCEGFRTYKGMPIHVKSAYYYNLLLDRHNLENKYETISSGDKVRYFYVKQPNKYGIKSMAYKYNYPKEFKDDIMPDTELMFNKIVYSAIERLYESVSWKPRKPGECVKTDLFDLLKP